jgi:hypothetical protein
MVIEYDALVAADRFLGVAESVMTTILPASAGYRRVSAEEGWVPGDEDHRKYGARCLTEALGLLGDSRR